MDLDTPFIEYLIIGAHTTLWLVVALFAVLDLPLSTLAHLDAGLIVVALPFIYLIGMLFESLSFQSLNFFRKRIKNKVFGDAEKANAAQYTDEYLAMRSIDLYNAYDVRVRRVRVIGAAIFNWLFLGAALLGYYFFDAPESLMVLGIIAGLAVVMVLVSIFAWRDLYNRAYRFRKNASDQIIEEDKRKATLARQEAPVAVERAVE